MIHEARSTAALVLFVFAGLLAIDRKQGWGWCLLCGMLLL